MKKLTFRVHAVQKMFERMISSDDVAYVLEHGEVIREYTDDTPFPSRLILGWRGKRPSHIVAADNDIGDETVIITAYEPDPALWTSDFRRKNVQP